MGHYKYFVEHVDTHQWWSGLDYTLDPHATLHHRSEAAAQKYIDEHPFLCNENVFITEHEFISSPSPMGYKLN